MLPVCVVGLTSGSQAPSSVPMTQITASVDFDRDGKQIGWLRPVTRRYRDQAMHYLERVGMADYAKRQISQLSGGQQQRQAADAH